MPGPIPGWLLLLGALTAVGPLSVDMYLPSLPTIARDLNTSSAAAGLTLTVFLISLAIGQLIYGPASDRFGRKPPLYIGLGLYVVASIGCAFAKDATMLAVLRRTCSQHCATRRCRSTKSARRWRSTSR